MTNTWDARIFLGLLVVAVVAAMFGDPVRGLGFGLVALAWAVASRR